MRALKLPLRTVSREEFSESCTILEVTLPSDLPAVPPLLLDRRSDVKSQCGQGMAGT